MPHRTRVRIEQVNRRQLAQQVRLAHALLDFVPLVDKDPHDARQDPRIQGQRRPVLAAVTEALVRRREAETQRQTHNEAQHGEQDGVDAQVVHVLAQGRDGGRVQADKEQRGEHLGQDAAVEAEAEGHAAELPNVAGPFKVLVQVQFEGLDPLQASWGVKVMMLPCWLAGRASWRRGPRAGGGRAAPPERVWW